MPFSFLTNPQDELESQNGPNFTDFSDLLAATPVTVDTGSQVSVLKLNGRLHELSLRDTPPVYFSQAMAPLAPSKGTASVTIKVKEEPLDVSVNEQSVSTT